jgi:hypothetical protein
MIGYGLRKVTATAAFLPKGDVAMNLELTDEDRTLLLEVLDGRLGELREEIHHSQVSGFTDELKRKEQSLKTLIGKVERASQ